MKEINKICVIGLGYIGLPTATLLAKEGYNVLGVDISEDIVKSINEGKAHIVEPNLQGYLEEVISNKKLKASLKPEKSDVFIIAVPTPFKNQNKEPDLSFVNKAIQSILEFISDDNLIILESTSPVGTIDKIEQKLTNNGIDISKINVGYCPERVLPGKIMDELVSNDRIVGSTNKTSASIIANFYRTFVGGKVFETEAKIAEMVKLVENSFRDVNIAFANELSMICHDENIDVNETIELANKHPRVNILSPGSGVGGHCIAVDPWFIISSNHKKAKIIRKAREVNLGKTDWVKNRIKEEIKSFKLDHSKSPIIGFLGLAYKPDIDDLRESQALQIAKEFKKENYSMMVVEPNISKHSDFEIYSLDEVLQKADILIILVSHKEFKDIKFNRVLNFSSA